jgi:putative ABC transport system permease protein
MNTFWQDLRYGARMLFKQPGFSLVAVLTLALGIGATAAIFSVVNSVLLRPLPYAQPERLMTIWEDYSARDGAPLDYTSPTGFADWRDQTQAFEHVAAYQGWRPTLTGPTAAGADEPEQLTGAAVSHDMFTLLGVPLAQGRGFRPEEDKTGAERVVVLSHSLWQRRFGADPAMVGKQVSLMGDSYTVIGVLPAGFKFPIIGSAEVFRTLTPLLNPGCQRGCLTIRVLARLRGGATETQARTELVSLAKRIEQQFPEANSKVGVALVPLHEFLTGEIKKPLQVLLGAVLLVLLIACVNVANLLLARASSREKEMAVRAALGAGRFRMVRQMLTESLLLALVGGALGLLLAAWLVEMLVAFSPDGTPRLEEIRLDRQVLAFTCGVTLLTGLFFGLAPAWQLARVELNQMLRDSSRGASLAQRGRRTLGALVVVETALALVLLTGAGLLMRSFVQLQRVDPGFNPRQVLTMNLSLPRAGYPERPQLMAFTQQMLERVKTLPGIEAAGVTSSLPLGLFNTDTSFVIEGRPAPPSDQQPVAWYSSVSPDYFRAMGMRLSAGRGFSERDDANAPRVVVITEAMARRYFPGESPLGKRLGNGRPDGWREIVGVLADVKHFGLSQDARPTFFMPEPQNPQRQLALVARSTTEPLNQAAAIRQVINSLDRTLAVSNVQTMERITAESIGEQRFTLLLFGLFASLALLLAAAGIYGVMSYAVVQRTPEIGVRMALGAQTHNVLRLVVGQGMKLIGIGVALGLAGALLLTRLLRTLLFGVSATDPLTFTVIALLLAGVALLACYLPARRATKVDPLVALRCE